MRSEPRCSRHWRYKSARSDVTLQQRPRRLHGISNDQISNSAFVGAVGLDAANVWLRRFRQTRADSRLTTRQQRVTGTLRASASKLFCYEELTSSSPFLPFWHNVIVEALRPSR